MGARRGVTRRRDGSYRVDLPDEERAVLARLASDLNALLDEMHTSDPDPSLTRLFPTAYLDRPDLDEEYRALVLGDLLDHHRDALETLSASAGATVLDESELAAWTAAINQVRLVLGTRLGVTEEEDPAEPDGTDDTGRAVYGYLTWLLDNAVNAALAGIDPEGTER